MDKPRVTLTGNLCTDVRVLGEEPLRVTFRMGSNPRRFDRATQAYVEDGDPQFYDVLCWRGLAANVRDSLRKGDPVVVTGSLRQKGYLRKSGEAAVGSEISAEVVGHDLNRGATHFRRTARPTAPVVPAQGGTGDLDVDALRVPDDLEDLQVDVATGEVLPG